MAGYRQGFTDKKGRGDLFFELMRIIAVKKPRVIFLENVKNLVSHDRGNTFRVILEALKEEGYHYRYQVLNAMEYGNTPQNRERIYIACFRNEADCARFSFPDPIPLTKSLSDIIDFDHEVGERYYYTDISLYFVSSHGQNRSFMNAPCTPVNDDLHRRQELPLHHLQ